ncbi:riboflavin synthase [Lactiplantibacillus modestisalitolerans]|uniref:Riboflavin synthase n=1 Tax=Lactiplantibacillus modestisalitolerans TaxID=1457219 RepID=A0ABV5WQX7_9LACO|nr:riboflavin synthase [Lactiplantibacillus modestisalitolerans]
MFTGIVTHHGVVQQVDNHAGELKLTLKAAALVTPKLAIGASIAVNGVCLTITTKTADAFTVDVMPESVRRTNLGRLKVGQQVNLEPALTAEQGLDGHFVQGHVDYCGELLRRASDASAQRLWFTLPAAYRPLIVEKGSVAIDGVSLTVVAVTPGAFEIDLIPHTQLATTLGQLPLGAPVNVETDILGKYVAQQLRFGGTENDD